MEFLMLGAMIHPMNFRKDMINVSWISQIIAEFTSSQISRGADVPDITQLFHSPTSNPGRQLQFSSARTQ
jgi:hypothetical protein